MESPRSQDKQFGNQRLQSPYIDGDPVTYPGEAAILAALAATYHLFFNFLTEWKKF